MHVVSLALSPRLRWHWVSLWPSRADLRQAVENFGYNLGLRSQRPLLPSHSYVEKIEYWAVVWGSVVMAITGVVLWAHDLVLAWLPKAAIDFATAIHFYEAVLATLSILAWHFYSVIFDPDVYPLDTAWLTGFSIKERKPPNDDKRPPAVE